MVYVDEKHILNLLDIGEDQLDISFRQGLSQDRDLARFAKEGNEAAKVVIQNYKDQTEFLIKNQNNFCKILSLWMMQEFENEEAKKHFPALAKMIERLKEDVKKKEKFLQKVVVVLKDLGEKFPETV